MDELNQIQNPVNIPPMQSAPLPVMPVKAKSSWFLVIVIAILAVGGFAWWYVGQMAEEPMVFEQFKKDREAREDMAIDQDIQQMDTVNLDAEFQAVDKDINSL